VKIISFAKHKKYLILPNAFIVLKVYNKNNHRIRKGRNMKKALLTLGIFILLSTSCTVSPPAEPTSTPVPPPTPTPTPDPCSKENILAEAEKVQMAVNEFREVADLANSTDFNFLFIPVLRLQEIRYQAIKVEVPACLDAFKTSAVNYTASVINYLMVFMNVQDPKSEDLNKAIQTSQTQWQVLLSEFNKVLAIAGVEPQVLPDGSSVAPTPTGGAALATNEGTEAINVRAKPDLNASVVASIEKGSQAQVIGRNSAGDWVQVNVNGITGWVFTEMLKISVPVDQLPVIEAAP
jgi:hypothetical protein